MPQEGLPPSVVLAKCQGASMWVPEWVLRRIYSVAQASPSAMSSFFRPGNIRMKLASICSSVWL